MINFNVPPFTGKEVEYMKEAIENQKICGDGPFTKKCNEWIEKQSGTAKCLLTTSCTHATEMAALLADGVPEALFAYNPEFSTESGGVVLLTAQVCGLEAELAEALASRRDRAGALAALSEALERRCPGLSVRPLGAELLLTPVREAAPAGR